MDAAAPSDPCPFISEFNRPLPQAVLTRLPARFAVVARGTITILVATTATAIATSAAIAAASATTPTAISARSVCSRPRFIHGQIASAELFAVELLDRRGCFFRRGHLDKAKAARATRHPIFHD